MSPIFFSSWDSYTKGLIVLLHSGLEAVIEIDNNPKRRFVSFKVTPYNDRVYCVLFMTLQDIAPENNWLEGVSLNN